MSIISTITSVATGWKTYAIVAIVSIMVAGTGYEYIYHKGESAQVATQAKAELKAEVKGVQVHAQVQNQVIKLADPDLDKQLDRWLRD